MLLTEQDILNANNVYLYDEDTIYVNIRDCYLKYKEGKTKKKLFLLGALLYTTSNAEKKEIIESLFDDIRIKYVLYKYFIL